MPRSTIFPEQSYIVLRDDNTDENDHSGYNSKSITSKRYKGGRLGNLNVIKQRKMLHTVIRRVESC